MSSFQSNLLSSGIGQAFADRNFRIYSVGSIASWISFFVQLVAVSWLAWELTGSTLWLAAIALMDIVPNVLLTPLAGAVADRCDRFLMWRITNLLLFIQALAVALLAWFELLSIWPLAGLVLVHGILISFTVPPMLTMLARFVHRSRLSSAIAVNSSYTQFAVFAGPALAGWIITNFNIATAFAVNAAGYAILLVVGFCLKTPKDYEPPGPSAQSFWGDLVEGLRYIAGHRGILVLLILLFAEHALTSSFYHMLPAYADEVLDRGIIGLSSILAAIGVGATIAALWLAHGGAKAATVTRVYWSYLIAVLATIGLMLVGNFYFAMALAVILGLSAEVRATATASLIQLTVAEAQRGRVMGNMFMLAQLAAGIGTYLIGAFAARHGLVAPMLVTAGLCLIVWLVLFLQRRGVAAYFSKTLSTSADGASPGGS